MFEKAHHFVIKGGTFTSVKGDQEKYSGLQILHKAIAGGAFHDSAERFPPPKCHPETRKAIIRHILKWIQDPLRSTKVLWLNGPAGAGKSAIAQTIAEICGENGELAASFFFSRTTPGRNTDKHLFATIAYQLALSILDVREAVNLAVQENPSILDRSLEIQMKKLIIEPNLWSVNEDGTQTLNDTPSSERPPRVIILDGLDECHGENNQCYILELIQKALAQDELPFCFLIASRPEPHIRESFDFTDIKEISHSLTLNNNFRPDDDIHLFLRSGLLDVRQKPKHRYSMKNVPFPWPSPQNLDQLVTKASGQFIYASTVLKFVDDPCHNPVDQLNIILGLQSVGTSSPYGELDQLYTQIMSACADVTGSLQVLGIILVMFAGLNGKIERRIESIRSPEILNIIDEILGLNDGGTYFLLRGLHSLIDVPDPLDPTLSRKSIRFYHASFPDYLTSSSRAKSYAVDLGTAHATITQWCLNTLSGEDSEESALSARLQVWSRGYATEVWCHHCSKATMTAGLLDLLRAFEPATSWMKSSIEVAARAMAEPTVDYELAPDNLLLVTVWLEYNDGQHFQVDDLLLKYYKILKDALVQDLESIRNPRKVLLALKAAGVLQHSEETTRCYGPRGSHWGTAPAPGIS